MNILKLAHRLGFSLIIWSIASIVVGAILLLLAIPVLQGIGLQALLWGIIDVVIAVFGVFRSKEQTAVKAARFLRINVYLDILYQVVGVLLIVFLWQDAFLLGNGIGVIIQGAFLFMLDLYFYRRFVALATT
jgi:hypothetical protein